MYVPTYSTVLSTYSVLLSLLIREEMINDAGGLGYPETQGSCYLPYARSTEYITWASG